MADALIETITSNPYESILSDTNWQIWNIQEDINKVTSAISTLEKQSPTSPTLPKLRERLAQLQDRLSSLNKTYDSAKTLLTSYNDSLANANTMEWIYRIKQAELNRAQKEADQSYRNMYEDVKATWNSYINSLWNATSSENAIINYNAWRQWASDQSTAEARARNYLSNAQAQAEASNNMIANLNAINEWRLNSNAWYVQLSQSNADNTLRQQVMNDFDAQQSALNRQAQYWWWSRSSNLSNIKLPDTTKNPKPWENDTEIVDPYDLWTVTNTTTSPDWNTVTVTTHYNTHDDMTKSHVNKVVSDYNSWKYWIIEWQPWLYHNNINWKVTYDNWWYWWFNNMAHSTDSINWWNVMIDLDREKTNNMLKSYDSNWDLWSTTVQATDRWYLIFEDWNHNKFVTSADKVAENYQWTKRKDPITWNWIIQ